MKQQKSFLFLLSLSFILLGACSKKNDQAPSGTTNVNPAVPGPSASLNQIADSMAATYRCHDNRNHTLSVLRITNSQGVRVNAALANEQYTKQIALGINCNKEFAIIKDYGSYMEAFLYLCDGTQVTNATLLKPVQTSADAVNSKYNRSAIVDMTLTTNTSFGALPLLFTSVGAYDSHGSSFCQASTPFVNGAF